MTQPTTASSLDKPCALYRDHGSSVPVITQGHHVYPVYLQNRAFGGIRLPELIWLCGTCHDSVHAWLYWLLGERKRPLMPVPARAKQLAVTAENWFRDAMAGR